jgi:YVTN family beta-propeller protein
MAPPQPGHGTVSVIDSLTFRVIATIRVGLSPQFVAVDPDHTTVGVTNFGDGTVSVTDTGTLTVTKTIPAGNRPYGIAVANNLGHQPGLGHRLEDQIEDRSGDRDHPRRQNRSGRRWVQG